MSFKVTGLASINLFKDAELIFLYGAIKASNIIVSNINVIVIHALDIHTFKDGSIGVHHFTLYLANRNKLRGLPKR